MVGSRDGSLGLVKSCFAAGKHAGAWVSLTASGVSTPAEWISLASPRVSPAALGVSTPLEWGKSDACKAVN